MMKRLAGIIICLFLTTTMAFSVFAAYTDDIPESNISRDVPSQVFQQIYNDLYASGENFTVISTGNVDITEEFKEAYLTSYNLLAAWQYVYDNVSHITTHPSIPVGLADAYTSQEAIYDILRCQKSGVAFEACFYVEFTYEVNSSNKITRSSAPELSQWLANPFDDDEGFKYSLSVKKNSYSINAAQTVITYVYNYKMACSILTTDGIYFEYDFPICYHTFSRSV